VVVVGLTAGLTGCTSFTVNADKNPPQVKSKGLVNAYFACNGIRPFDRRIIEAGVFSDSDRWGNVASLDVWPIAGIGISLIGARVKLLPFELGLGILGYDPEPESYVEPDDEDESGDAEETPAVEHNDA